LGMVGFSGDIIINPWDSWGSYIATGLSKSKSI
jgi:hypothetical protein